MENRVLVVDDDKDMCEVVAASLRKRGLAVEWFTSAAEALECLKRESFDVVVSDLRMPGIDGLKLCRQIVESHPDIPVVVMTAFGSFEYAVDAIRSGAYDFVTKPIEMDVLALAVHRGIEHRQLHSQVRRLSETIERHSQFSELIGESPAIDRLREQLKRVATVDATILISGESGTGKEVVANALHQSSRRSGGPFLAINCSALQESLLESELFGHAKGAFTDARDDRDGLFVQADGGTLFLDEIGEMPQAMQAKLLRALEDRYVRPVGGNQTQTFDARLITATNRDLPTEVEAGRFREDLFYRIDVVHIELPPLRHRGNDVLLLAQHFINQFIVKFEKPALRLTDGAAKKFLGYDWPGNVRELRNAIESAVAVTRFDCITVDDLPNRIQQHQGTELFVASGDPHDFVAMEEIERRYIRHVLKALGGNRTRTAETLGLGRKTLYRKLQNFGID